MGLKDEISVRNPRFEDVINQLSDEDRADLEEVLGDPRYTAPSIARALQRRGIDVSVRTIERRRQTIRERNL